MAGSLIGMPSRLAIFVCGIISLAVGRVYWELHDLDHTFSTSWSLFSVALIVVGGFAVVIALLPSSWAEKVCKIKQSEQRRSSFPLKMLGGFALSSYLLTLALNFAAHGEHPSPQLVYAICPACVLTITVDPSLGTFLLLLAPLNAAVYGSLGAVLGYILIVQKGS